MSILLRISFLLCFLSPVASWGEVDEWVETRSFYYPQKGDSLNFIQEKLLYKAFDRSIKKLLKNKGKSEEKFFNSFDEKFEESFKGEGEDYKKRLGYKDDLRSSQKKDIEQKYDRYRFRRKIRYDDFYRIIKSHKIEKQWRDTKNPSVRVMKVKVNIDVPALMKKYALYTVDRSKTEELGKTLYIVLNYELDSFSWDDLDFNDESSFKDSLLDAWIRWIERDFQQKNVFVLVKPGNQIPSEGMRKGDSKLNLHLKITKNTIQKEFKKYEFKFLVDFSVFSYTGELLYEGTSEKQTKSFSGVGSGSLPNLMANYIYKIPLDNFIYIAKSLKEKQNHNQKDQLIVLNFTNHQKINELMKLLNSYGAELNLQAKIDTITSNKVTLELLYQGTKDKLIETIKVINQNGFPLNMKSKEFPLTISL